MKRLIFVFLFLSFNLLIACSQNNTGALTAQKAYETRLSEIWLKATGEVEAILSDDLEGSRHQRFIIRLENGQTLIISHNIDIAPRVNNLEITDKVEIYGEYLWNDKGGVMHWTHHDPQYRQKGGWIKHKGKVYK